jgi:MFS family permease
MSIFTRINQAPRELKLFSLAALILGLAFSSISSVLNNFLNERFVLDGLQRSFLEIPRELPGFLVVFVSAALWFLCSRRLAGLAMILLAGGALLVGFLSQSYGIMVIWLFIYSMGDHIFLPLASGIGMELAREGKTGQRLGQLNSIRNIAAIAGSALVFIGFQYFGFTFQYVFAAAWRCCLAHASKFLSHLRPGCWLMYFRNQPPPWRLC